MRIVATVLIGAAALMWAAPASAGEYPWCAVYGFWGESGTNCGFVSFAQCLDTIRGAGGSCRQNPLYEEPRAEAPRKKRKAPRAQ
jgi:hypothetical protein